MDIVRNCQIDDDLKKLKRFPAPLQSLESWERFFCFKGFKETPGVTPYPGFGSHKVFKVRVVPLKENCGKSDGYRLILRLVDSGQYEILVFSRHGVYKSEGDLMKIIKNRL